MKIQVSTTPEQSQRLIACGVNPKSADMTWQVPITTSQKKTGGKVLVFRNPNHQDYVGDVPAWSLSVLLAFLPKDLMWQGLYYRLVFGPNEKGWEIEYNDLSVINNLHRVTADSLIEAVVQMIEWLTKENYKLNEIKK